METFSALLAICAGNSPVPGEFPAQRPVTRSFDVFFDLRLNKRLSKQPWGWWFETPAWSLWRHRNVWKGLNILRSARQWYCRFRCKKSKRFFNYKINSNETRSREVWVWMSFGDKSSNVPATGLTLVRWFIYHVHMLTIWMAISV